MRFTKPLLIIVFIVGTAFFVFKWASFKGAIDTVPPEIHMSKKMITVDVDATDRELMKNVQIKRITYVILIMRWRIMIITWQRLLENLDIEIILRLSFT